MIENCNVVWQVLASLLVIATAVLAGFSFISFRANRKVRMELRASREIIDEMTQEHWVFLSEANRALSESLDYNLTISKVAELAVPGMSDVCWVDLMEENGDLRRVARGGVLESGPILSSASLKILKKRESVLYDRLGADELDALSADAEEREQLEKANLKSLIVISLSHAGNVLGAIVFGLSRSGMRYGSGDLNVCRQIANRAALAIGNARLHKQAQDAVLARDHMVAVVSHDLKNPLLAIRLRSELLLKLLPDELATIRKHVEQVGASVDGMTKLIDDLLDLRKLEFGNVELKIKTQSTNQLITEALQPLEVLAVEKGLKLQQNLLASDFSIAVDRDRVFQVISNVVGNAIKFTSSGHVSLSAVRELSGVRISVQDSGQGIPQGELAKIFDPYWQADRTAKAGAGLGLAISRAIVEKHGGKIWAENRAEGGTTIHFTLLTKE